MKITFTYLLGTTPVTKTLGDDAVGDVISGYLPSARITVQRVQRPAARAIAHFNRRNREWTIPFITTRTHADEATALNFLEDHPAEVTQQGTLRVEREGRTRIGDEAVLEVCEAVSWDGATTVHQYRLVCGSFRSGPTARPY